MTSATISEETMQRTNWEYQRRYRAHTSVAFRPVTLHSHTQQDAAFVQDAILYIALYIPPFPCEVLMRRCIY